MTAVLRISDGTTTISLLNGVDGFHLNAWRPTVAQYKGGGTWQSSPLSSGRRLVTRQFANAVEAFDLKVQSLSSQDDAIHYTQELRRLLEKAVDYWTADWQDEPVWVEAQATCETNSRYAIIHSYSTPDDENPFNSPFLQPHGAIMDRWGLIIERGHWLSDEPGTASCIEVTGAAESEDGGVMAFYPEISADDAYITNNVNTISLTDLRFGTGGGLATYGAGIRFRNITIPPDTTPTRAWVRFQSTNSDAGGVDVDIDVEDVASPAAFSTYADFVGRPRVGIPVNWVPTAWVINRYYDTPDISARIADLTFRNDWQSGNDIVVFLDENASASARYPGSVDTEPTTEMPVLFIAFDDGDGPLVRGKSRSCDGDIFAGNKQTLAQISHIYVADGAVWGANRIGDTDFTMLPAAAAQNDDIYFGVDNNATDPGPFCSLVFNIGTVQQNLDIVWEYWDSTAGPGWDTLTVQDNTNADGAMTGQAFDTAGVGSIHWEPPSDWIANDPGVGVTGYWVRARVSNVPAGPVSPIQQDDQIYSIIWGHYRVDDGDAEGDIPLLSNVELENVSAGRTGATALTDFHSRRLVAGLRSDVRGTRFTAYLNLADRGNPTGFTVDVSGDATTSIVDRPHAPTGRAVFYNPAGAAGMVDRVEMQFSTALGSQYFGIFHVFMRVYQASGAAGVFEVQLDFDAGLRFSTPIVPVNDLEEFEVLDFGRVALPAMPNLADGEQVDVIYFDVAVSTTGAEDLYLYDVIFVPVDEWAGEFIWNDAASNALLRTKVLEIDSVINPRSHIRALLKETATGPIESPWRTVSNGEIIHQANADQKMWGFQMYTSGTTGWLARPEIACGIDVDAARRYLASRGVR